MGTAIFLLPIGNTQTTAQTAGGGGIRGCRGRGGGGRHHHQQQDYMIFSPQL